MSMTKGHAAKKIFVRLRSLEADVVKDPTELEGAS